MARVLRFLVLVTFSFCDGKPTDKCPVVYVGNTCDDFGADYPAFASCDTYGMLFFGDKCSSCNCNHAFSNNHRHPELDCAPNCRNRPLWECQADLQNCTETIDLKLRGLVGTVPLWLGNDELRILDLFGNQLSGTIGDDWSILNNKSNHGQHLQFMELGFNNFHGTLPSVVGSLSNLIALNIGFNSGLTNQLPPSVGSLSELRSLVYSVTGIGGTLPSSVGSLKKLRVFHILATATSGTLPPSFGSLTSLKCGVLADNRLSGTIPTSLGSMKSVKFFSLINNNFRGTLPPFSSLNELTFLEVYNNKLSGNLPVLLNSSKLRTLYIFNTLLSGTIPRSWNNLISLVELSMSDNLITGTIPPLDRLHRLQSFSAQINSLRGLLPPSVGSLASLTSLSLSRNFLSGQLPASLGSATNLQRLSLEHNNFVGPLPRSLRNLSMLQGAFFDMNQLTGTLDPMVWGKPHIQACSVLGTKIQPANLPRSDLHDQCRLSHFRSCPSPSQRTIANVAFRTCENTATNTNCTYTCAPGYSPLPGHRTILCGAGGMWLDAADAGCPFCRFCCNAVPDRLVPHASKKSKVTCEGTSRYGVYLGGGIVAKGLCDLDCDENYQLANTSKLQILCNFGSWLPPPQGGQCVPKTCTSPTKITRIAPSSCEGTLPNSACRYQCKVPFVARPDNDPIVCVSGGLWRDLPAPHTGCACGDVPANLVPNADMAMCANQYGPNEHCKITCLAKFSSAYADDLVISCGLDGNWSWSSNNHVTADELCATNRNCWEDPTELAPNANTTNCTGTLRENIAVVDSDSTCVAPCLETFEPATQGVDPKFICTEQGDWKLHRSSGECIPTLCNVSNGDNVIDPRAFHETSGLDTRDLPKSTNDGAATNLKLDRCAAGMIFSGEIDFDVMCCPLGGTPAYVPVKVGSEQCPHGAVVAFKECRKREYYKILGLMATDLPSHMWAFVLTAITIGILGVAMVILTKKVFFVDEEAEKKKQLERRASIKSKGKSILRAFSAEYKAMRGFAADNLSPEDIRLSISGVCRNPPLFHIVNKTNNKVCPENKKSIIMEVSRMASEKAMDLRKEASRGYNSIKYTMMLSLLLNTFDLVTDLLFIHELGTSEWMIGAYFSNAAVVVLGASMLINFVGFFGVYVYARKFGCVDDKLWEDLMFPWVVIIAVASITSLHVMVLLPWTKRSVNDLPTRCAYMTCNIAAYFEATTQLCISVAWMLYSRDYTNTLTLLSASFSVLTLLIGFYRVGIMGAFKSAVQKGVNKGNKKKRLAFRAAVQKVNKARHRLEIEKLRKESDTAMAQLRKESDTAMAQLREEIAQLRKHEHHQTEIITLSELYHV